MARIFDSSFEGRDNVTRKRHGMPWLPTELLSLRELYQEGKSLQEMCEMLERPATGTLTKLVGVGCLTRETDPQKLSKHLLLPNVSSRGYRSCKRSH